MPCSVISQLRMYFKTKYEIRNIYTELTRIFLEGNGIECRLLPINDLYSENPDCIHIDSNPSVMMFFKEDGTVKMECKGSRVQVNLHEPDSLQRILIFIETSVGT